MRTGGLKEILRVFRPVLTTDQYGAEQQTWETVGEFRAERSKRTGSLSDEVGEHFAATATEWNVHYALSDKFDVNWRVADVRDGGTLYTIQGKEPNRDRGLVVLKCEKVND